ncbi:5-formyltetrahydrofolate cyclo-ligase [Planosporangium mesophilum]|uniref:5-formyltetrahydrofolate cyclo-ligase n=1 Tax=Planosporangium mesophilum TaxID=689768 RepID=A0A8J3T909_9ACTN|nr:5-formyltetrahydrofolate cyclo-ligase [Planosporangium mesophilum]
MVSAAPGRDKRAIRSAVLSARRTLSPQERSDADAAIREALATVVARVRPGTVCAYLPMAGEPGGARLPELPGVGRVLLPVLRPDLDLDWAAYPAPLLSGRYGLSEPDGPRLGVDAIAEAELIVAPGLAVSTDGVRLGRGGGSYDRALARVAPSALVVVPLYDGELVDRLPAEPHDRPVDAVVTPSGVGLVTHTGRNRSG